jgi:nitric oxide reductase NorD protein
MKYPHSIQARLNTIIKELNAYKPELINFFYNALEILHNNRQAGIRELESIRQLTIVSEYIYINIEPLMVYLLNKKELNTFSSILYYLYKYSYKLAKSFFTVYPSLEFPLLPLKEDIIYFTDNAVKNNISNSEMCFEYCFTYKDADKCSFLLKNFGAVALYTPGTLKDFVTLLINKRNYFSWELIIKWVTRGTDLITSNRIDEGVSFLLLRSKESRWLLGFNNVVLDDLKNILKIYCASLSGQEMIINSQESSGFGFKNPYTDGKNIFLPPEIHYFENPELNERAFIVLAAQQAASVAMGSFELDISELDFRGELAERYGTVLPPIIDNVRKQYRGQSVRERADGEIEITFTNGRRILALNTEHEKFFYSFPTPHFVKDLFILIENARIEYMLSGLYSGLKEDFEIVNKYLWETRNPVFTTKRDDILIAVECLIQLSLFKKIKGEIKSRPLLKTIDSLFKQFVKIFSKYNTVQDSARICYDIYNIFYEYFQIVAYFNRSSVHDNFTALNKPEIIAEVVLDTAPDLLKSEKIFTSVDDLEKPEAAGIDLTSISYIDKNAEELNMEIEQGQMKIFKYPEYNYYKKTYERKHCTLFERSLDSYKSDYYIRTIKKYKREYKRIRKRFLYMKPDNVEMSRRWESGDDIHTSDAVDYLMDIIRNESPDDRVYFRKIKNLRDIAAGILVDASSSTDNEIRAGGSKIIDIEKAALALLGSALSIVGDNFGIFSFFSMGRSRVFFNIVKDFDEQWNDFTQARIPEIQAYAANRDGCAIRHITSRLLDEPNKTKLLILLSDGIPADTGYGSKSSSDTSGYAIEDTRRAILEAKQAGIIPFCITIDRFAKKYIPHLYGNYQYAILDDVTRLPEKMSQLYLRITR